MLRVDWAGFKNLDAALVQFPESVFETIAYLIQNPGSTFSDISEAIHYLSTDTAGQAAGETGAALNAAFASSI